MTGLAFDGTYIWVEAQDEVVEILPSTGAVIGTYPASNIGVDLAHGDSAIAFDGANVWVLSYGGLGAGTTSAYKF